MYEGELSSDMRRIAWNNLDTWTLMDKEDLTKAAAQEEAAALKWAADSPHTLNNTPPTRPPSHSCRDITRAATAKYTRSCSRSLSIPTIPESPNILDIVVNTQPTTDAIPWKLCEERRRRDALSGTPDWLAKAKGIAPTINCNSSSSKQFTGPTLGLNRMSKMVVRPQQRPRTNE